MKSNASMWDERFGQEDYAYGVLPNEWLKERISTLEVPQQNAALFPADGEGRNAVWAATLGWNSEVFDLSIEGKKKCNLLALHHGVQVEYHVDDLALRPFVPHTYDLMACSWFHTPSEIRKVHMPRMLHALKPGSRFIMEGYHTSQLPLSSGGPKSLDLLFDLDELIAELTGKLAPPMKIIHASVETVTLTESALHEGRARVIRLDLLRV